jgi:hypothetical protein
VKTNSFILATAIRKLVIVFIMGTVTICAFATLGEGNFRKEKSKKPLLSAKSQATPGIFSLHSGYIFRGNQVIDFKENKYISLNTVITYQQGNTTYTLPLKKKVILNNKITFNPNPATR